MGAFGILLLIHLNASDVVRPGLHTAWRLSPAVALIFLVGLADDLWGLKPWHKILGQLAAAGLAVHAGVLIGGIRGHEMPGWLGMGVTVVWLIGCTNAVNLIDGVDGLATGVGLFATLTTLAAALMGRNVELALATAPLAGALLGFLRYNFNPASIFLGDCGSLPLGFLLGCFAVQWGQKSTTLLGMTAPLMALAIPLLDTALAIVRRFLRREPIFGADSGHIHHRLLARGMTPRGVALLLYGVCGLGAMLSLLSSILQNYTGLILVLFCAGTWIGIQNLGYTEFGTARRMLQSGAFRGMLGRELQLGGFRERLRQAESVEACWAALLDTYAMFGFCEVEARLGGVSNQHRGPEADGSAWEVLIPLEDGDYVRLVRHPGASTNTVGAAEFAEEVSRLLGERLAALPGKKAVLAMAQAAGAGRESLE
jgi:UDP-GlcNAc:undecaprenyl-phosphate GlcNAc-1-phosphate transferase